jgi:hypothetical protein
MKRLPFCSLFCLLSLAQPQLRADDETDKAITAVQEELRNPGEGGTKFKSQSPDAAKTADQVHQISGSPANEAEIYKLAADVLGNMKGLTPDQMQKLLVEAASNPEAFTKKWTPEQIKKLKEISGRLPASQQTSP